MKGPSSVLALLLLLGSAFVVQAEYLIKFSHTEPSTTVKGRAADYFAEQVNKRLAGKVNVEVFPDASLHDDADVLEAVRQSDGDSGIMAAPGIGRFVDVAGGLRIFELPFLFDRIEDVHRLVDSPLVDRLFQPLDGDGIKGLAIWDEGMKIFSVSGARPLRKPPEDFQGRKLGTSGSEIDKAMIEALGGIAREVSVADLYGALSEGTLDGQESLWSQTAAAKLYAVQDWISVSDHGYRGSVLVLGTRFWSGLPEDVRDELTLIVGETTAQARTYAAKSLADERARIEDAGTAIVLGLTSSERDEWRKVTADVQKRFAAQIGEDLVADVREFLAQPELPPPALLEGSGQIQSGQPARFAEDAKETAPGSAPRELDEPGAAVSAVEGAPSSEAGSSEASEPAGDSESPPAPAEPKR